jgi:signal transduction histidine kinase
LLFVLAAIMLVGSVVLPAGESERVLALVDEDERVLEPLRLLSSRLGAGIAGEAADLQRFRNSGDSTALARFQRTRSRDDSSTASMRDLSMLAGGEIATEAESLRRLVMRWNHVVDVDGGGHPTATRLSASAFERETVRDSIVLSIAGLEADLAARSAERRTAVTEHERRGVVINAAQVLIALGALIAVFEVLRRERRRARREAALRGVAESLARAFDKQDVAQRAAEGAMELLSAASVSVAHVENGTDEMHLTLAAATGATLDASRAMMMPSAESELERAIRDGRPSMIAAAAIAHARPAKQRAMVIPLGTAHLPIGAVVAFESSRVRFHQDDLAWAGIFAHLASFAYERMRLLDEARAGQAGLQRVIESRGRLMRGFSHDLKNPLGAADGYAALLQDGIYGTVSKEQVASIARVRQAIHRALSLIEDLHELARAETGRLDLQRERVDLAELVRGAAEEYRATAAVKQLGFVLDVPSELPGVDTDPSRVRQIVGNLLSNAIKYTDTGVVTLRARADAAGPSNEAADLLIEVQDTGPGIPLDKQSFIFDEFARLSDGRHAGAGVGLAISKHVADALGCRLEVASTVGEGATFTLRIPLHPDVPGSASELAHATTEGSTETRTSREAKGART